MTWQQRDVKINNEADRSSIIQFNVLRMIFTASRKNIVRHGWNKLATQLQCTQWRCSTLWPINRVEGFNAVKAIRSSAAKKQETTVHFFKLFRQDHPAGYPTVSTARSSERINSLARPLFPPPSPFPDSMMSPKING